MNLRGPVEPLGRGADHVHPDPETGDSGHRLRGAEAGAKHEVDQFPIVQPPRGLLADHPLADRRLANLVRVDPAAVVLHLEDDPPLLRRRGDHDPPFPWLPCPLPLRGGLDPVVDRIPQDVGQRFGEPRPPSGRSRSCRRGPAPPRPSPAPSPAPPPWDGTSRTTARAEPSGWP